MLEVKNILICVARKIICNEIVLCKLSKFKLSRQLIEWKILISVADSEVLALQTD